MYLCSFADISLYWLHIASILPRFVPISSPAPIPLTALGDFPHKWGKNLSEEEFVGEEFEREEFVKEEFMGKRFVLNLPPLAGEVSELARGMGAK
ncbi:hypothetical protein F9873_09835 [Glaesserella parasuis]|nr:hypothetical protein [Glaesserella parasuis]